MNKEDFYYYEIKSSVEDFHSKNGHNFLGDYNYYVMPEEVYGKVKNEIPYDVGVLVPGEKNCLGDWYDLRSVKKARRKDRSAKTGIGNVADDVPVSSKRSHIWYIYQVRYCYMNNSGLNMFLLHVIMEKHLFCLLTKV